MRDSTNLRNDAALATQNASESVLCHDTLGIPEVQQQPTAALAASASQMK